jgi:hypothetical protein
LDTTEESTPVFSSQNRFIQKEAMSSGAIRNQIKRTSYNLASDES